MKSRGRARTDMSGIGGIHFLCLLFLSFGPSLFPEIVYAYCIPYRNNTISARLINPASILKSCTNME
jgi:hypothetical protein